MEIIADNLHKAGWSLDWVSALDVEGRTIWIVDADGYGKRFIVHAVRVSKIANFFEVKPNKMFRLVHQTVTAPDGKYHFTNVHPRQYVLRIGGINYPLEVRDTQMQDIPVIAKPRH